MATERSLEQLAPRVRFVLVRHAESIWNAAGVLQGHDGPGLSDRGAAQAAALAAEIARTFSDVAVVVSSDLERAKETAILVSSKLHGGAVRFDERLREADIRSWSGRTLAQVAREDPGGLRAWLSGEDVRRGGGETKVEMLSRVTSVIDEALQEARAAARGGQPRTVVIITHGGPIRMAIASLLGLFPDAYWPLEPPHHTSISVMELDEVKGTILRGRLQTFNQTGHVTGLLGPSIPGVEAAAGA